MLRSAFTIRLRLLTDTRHGAATFATKAPAVPSKPGPNKISLTNAKARDGFIAQIRALTKNPKDRQTLAKTLRQIRLVLPLKLRQSYYERTINILLEKGHKYLAHQLYFKVLQERLTPSASTTTHFLHHLKDPSSKGDANIADLLHHAILEGRVAWDQGLLAFLLENCIRWRKYAIMDTVLHLYRQAAAVPREKERLSELVFSLMIKGKAEANLMRLAVSWLRKYRTNRTANERQLRPYLTLLECLVNRGGRNPSARACHAIVRQMTLDGVALATPVFNALMSMEVRRLSIGRAFAMYKVMQRRYPTLRPDSATFAVLFKAHDAWQPGMRKMKPSARGTFRQMLIFHYTKTRGYPAMPSTFIDASTLNVAIRTFIKTRDYAAALTALQTFTLCGLVPTSRTQWIVASTILYRGRASFKTGGDRQFTSWVKRMEDALALGSEGAMEAAIDFRRGIQQLRQEMQKELSSLQDEESILWIPSSKNSDREDSLYLPPLLPPRQPHVVPVDLQPLMTLVTKAMEADLVNRLPSGADLDAAFLREMDSASRAMLPNC